MKTLGIAAIAVAAMTVSFGGCTNEGAGSSQNHSGQKSQTSSSGAAPTPKEVIDVLGSHNFDSAISVMNRIKRARYKNDLIGLLDRIWRNDASTVGQVDGEFVNSPRIRVEIADVLIQASRNGTQGLNSKEYAAFAREHALSSDSDVARQAILVLGIANEEKDVPLLKQLLKSENKETFAAAAIAISHSCAISKPELAEIERQLKSSENSNYLANAWDDLATLRKATCSSQ